MAKSRKLTPEPTNQPRIPYLGEKVAVGAGSSIWTVNKVSSDGSEVSLHVEGTNLERFRVPVADLYFVDAPRPSAPPKSVKPAIPVEEIRERLANAQHSSMDQLSGDIAILKKYLKSKGVDATDELDRLCKATEQRWADAVESIEGMLE